MQLSREELIFGLALSKSGAERGAFLDRECGGDLNLRARLQRRLGAPDGARNQPGGTDTVTQGQPAAGSFGPCSGPSEAPAEVSQNEAVGQTLGRYRLLERIGEGGCGVVYVAEQTEPVRRRVALKVIKLGMDTKAVVARFEAERQALALMDHPNIAKVLDGGTTDPHPASGHPLPPDGRGAGGDGAGHLPSGRPYFVMELVRGVRITDYCDQNHLTTRERLELFIPVCQAIQHAHQKGIIHRDIKPSNILVTLHDGVPVPKVIDFGIAKATEGRLTDATVYTQLHQFIGTPAYMSPEQAEMSGLDVDTRSDIYSLGVLLYELLTGKTPFDAKELVSQGIDSMRKTIREQDPLRPSTRLATLKGEELTTTAKRRSVETGKLAHQLRGDLDWIVMKCLEKDRRRRYETANGLAADLKRHLNDEPVTARPASRLYRIRKVVRRNRLACAAAALVGLALLTGTVVSLWQAVRATRAETLALQTRTDSEELSNFILEDLYAELEPTQRFDLIARLARNVVDYYHRLPASLRTPNTDRNRAMAEARLAIMTARQGDAKSAQPLAASAMNTFEAMAKAGDHSEGAIFGLGLALFAQHWCYNVRRDVDAMILTLRRAAEVLKPLASSPQGSRRVKLLYAEVLNFFNHLQPTDEQSVTMCEEAMRVLAEVGALDLAYLPAATAWADTADSEARHLELLGRLDQAERLERQARSVAERVLARSPGDLRAQYVLAEALDLLAEIAQQQFRYAEAVELTKASQSAAEEYTHTNPSDDHGQSVLSRVDFERARLALQLGHPKEALQTIQETLERRSKSSGNTPFRLGMLGAFCEAQLGNRPAAEQALRQARRDLDAYGNRADWTDPMRAVWAAILEDHARLVQLAFGEDEGVFDSAKRALGPLDALADRAHAKDVFPVRRPLWLAHPGLALDATARSGLNLRRYQEAEVAARALIELRFSPGALQFYRLDEPWGRVLLAEAQVGQRRAEAALETIAPALAHYRALQLQGANDLVFRQQFARALYVQALGQPATQAGVIQRRGSLAQAARMLKELPEEAQQLHDTKELLSWIEAEQKQPSTGGARL